MDFRLFHTSTPPKRFTSSVSYADAAGKAGNAGYTPVKRYKEGKTFVVVAEVNRYAI